MALAHAKGHGVGLILPRTSSTGVAPAPGPSLPSTDGEDLDWARIAAEVLREAVGQAVRWQRAVTMGRTPYEGDEAAAAWLGLLPDAAGLTFEGVAELLGRSPGTLRQLVAQEVEARAACLGAKAKRRMPLAEIA